MKIEKHLPWLIPVGFLTFCWVMLTASLYHFEWYDFNRTPSFKESQINIFRFLTGQDPINLD